MEEHVFFDIDGVTVTNKRFVVNCTTYAMHSVSHIKQLKIPPSHFGPVWTVVFGLIAMLFGGIGQAIGFLMIVTAILSWVRQKPVWTVMAGPAQVNSDQREYIEQLVKALNAAMASQA